MILDMAPRHDTGRSVETPLVRLLLFARGDRRAEKDTTRHQIMVAAIQLFTRLGYGGTSMRAIASEVGIQAASIYAHFPQGKSQILFEGLREIFEEFLAHLISPLTPEMSSDEQLGTIIEQHVLWQLDYGSKALAWDAAFSGLGVHGVLADEQQKELRRLQRLYHDYLAELIAEQVPQGADVRRLTRLCLLLCDDAGRVRANDEPTDSVSRFVRSLFMDDILRAVAPST
ncbi:TetR/AcrR family transcriptional regulator [Microbacterium sp. NPDC055357]